MDVVLEPAALQLAALTPTAGWGALGDPAASPRFTQLEYRCRMKRAWRQIVEHTPGNRRQFGETLQQWVDRLYSPVPTEAGHREFSVPHDLHVMATAFANGVTS